MSICIVNRPVNFNNNLNNNLVNSQGIQSKINAMKNEGVFKVPLPRRPQPMLLNIPLKNSMLSKIDYINKLKQVQMVLQQREERMRKMREEQRLRA